MGRFGEFEADAGEFGAQLVGLGDALCGELAVGGELGDEGGFLLGAGVAPGAEAVEGGLEAAGFGA